MSRSRLPPTPAMSGELIVKEQMSIDGADVFTLPPAAMSPSKLEGDSRRSSKSDQSAYFPVSPTSPRSTLGRGANPSRQASMKRPLEDFGDLPPPPTRTRKIIQMKPKTQTSSQSKSTSSASKSSKDNGKNATNDANAAPVNSKKKQPSATSAAGRKIARKTAHSLIERRRRSKMNEEFATLKDMIPACRNQDMHKLAILQASIDYVNYLEQCIHGLKTGGDTQAAAVQRLPPAPPSPPSPMVLGELAESTYSASVSPDLLPTESNSHVTSPAFSPRNRIHSIGTVMDFAPSTLPSPALHPTQQGENGLHPSHRSWAAPYTDLSPDLQPQNRPASSADMDHEASAALLMLNRDFRGSISSARGETNQSMSLPLEDRRYSLQDAQRKVGISVKDLLTP
ncbi:hypothetical protein BDV25DRAFT_164476 [Aspergillus avenaceus]|uniref:BHLH domain-containing protein n=1 Tax=Aspergillus avenaceus TaxID=36643 RepID=A0A5N6TGM8_ASPAV|nr:hypothetical protein BDV25DRAFT_164476 [Aspergillus avenaceus]